MKTREQLLWKICEVLQDVKCLHVGEQELNRITDLVVEACEEIIGQADFFHVIGEYPDGSRLVKECDEKTKEEILENLKKLKSK